MNALMPILVYKIPRIQFVYLSLLEHIVSSTRTISFRTSDSLDSDDSRVEPNYE